jgi:hypothetical protein
VESEDMPDSGFMPWKETDAMKERVKVGAALGRG